MVTVACKFKFKIFIVSTTTMYEIQQRPFWQCGLHYTTLSSWEASRTTNTKQNKTHTFSQLLTTYHTYLCKRKYVKHGKLCIRASEAGRPSSKDLKWQCSTWHYGISCKNGSGFLDCYFFNIYVEARASWPPPRYAPELVHSKCQNTLLNKSQVIHFIREVVVTDKFTV